MAPARSKLKVVVQAERRETEALPHSFVAAMLRKLAEHLALDREWLKTPEGRAWLETNEGTDWIRSKLGYEWSQLDDGRAWLDELAQRGFADFFAGKFPEPPKGRIMPNDAPQIGARVRVIGGSTTLGGTTFEDRELAIVSELHLMPMGLCVRCCGPSMAARGFAMFLDELVPATS